MTAVPYQKPGVPESAGLSAKDCERAAWAVETGGSPRRYRGAGAINASLAAALGVGFPLSFYELSGVRGLQDLAYSFIAAVRHYLPGDEPYCDRHPGECR